MKVLFATITSILLIGLFSAFSSSNNTKNLDATTSEYSGEELYKALFQFRGDFVSKVDGLNSTRESLIGGLEKKDIALLNEFYDNVNETIKTVDPKFFARFEKEVKSKDFNRMENAFEEAANVSMSALVLSEHFKNALSDEEHQILVGLSKKYDLATKKGLIAFSNMANEQTSLNIDVAKIEAAGTMSAVGQGAAIYAGFLAVVAAVVLNAALAAHAVAVYAGVAVAQSMYVYNSVKWWGSYTVGDTLEKEKFMHDLVMAL